jgi:hypothetical protein
VDIIDIRGNPDLFGLTAAAALVELPVLYDN